MVHPALIGFFLIGHTQVYWPLLFVFAWLLRSNAGPLLRRWPVASSLHGRPWRRSSRFPDVPLASRLLTTLRLAVLAAAVVIPLAPVSIADAGALWYGLYGSYQKVMKEVRLANLVRQDTIGTTGSCSDMAWSGMSS